MANLALSARDQIQQVEKDLEPKLDKLLAQKVKPHAIRKNDKKETVFRLNTELVIFLLQWLLKSISRERILKFRINR